VPDPKIRIYDVGMKRFDVDAFPYCVHLARCAEFGSALSTAAASVGLAVGRLGTTAAVLTFLLPPAAHMAHAKDHAHFPVVTSIDHVLDNDSLQPHIHMHHMPPIYQGLVWVQSAAYVAQ
jgi:hypothetical protein